MQRFNDVNRKTASANHFWVIQPYPYANRAIQQPPQAYAQYPPIVYQPPYNAQINQPVQPQYFPGYAPPPTPISKTPANKPPANLPPAPIGRAPKGEPIKLPHPTISYPPMLSAPIQQPVVPVVPVAYSQPIVPPVTVPYSQPVPLPPQYYYSPAPPLVYPNHQRPNLPSRPPRDFRPKHNSSHRYRPNEPPIMSYFGRRYEMDPYQKHNRWYQ